jgi:hypothetical protein
MQALEKTTKRRRKIVWRSVEERALGRCGSGWKSDMEMGLKEIVFKDV